MGQLLAPHIESVPGKCGGRPCIAGTRVRVQDIYIWHELRGMSPEEILKEAAPHITRSDVYAALSYYLDHHEEIRAEVERERDEYERQKRTAPSKLRAKSMGADGNGNTIPA